MAKRASIEEAKTHFGTEVANPASAAKWSERTSAAAEDYGTFFKPYLDAQNACGQSVEKLSRYEALLKYASCMKGKMG